VLHTLPDRLHGTREPLQFGAEIYGHGGLEADLEAQELALDSLKAAGVGELMIDLGDARILRGLLCDVTLPPGRLAELAAALNGKDASAVEALTRDLPPAARAGLNALPRLYGSDEVLREARRALPDQPLIAAALDELAWLREHLLRAYPGLRVGFDLADSLGNAYYTGARFAIYGARAPDALVRGGRYDEVGEVFGRKRPAVGFSLDVKGLAAAAPTGPLRAAIRAPWGEDAALRAAVRRLREQGETVVCMLPGHEHEGDEFACDRALTAVDGQWVLRAL
jgi:ATP phosphoribosyltransferase regulatory subunit